MERRRLLLRAQASVRRVGVPVVSPPGLFDARGLAERSPRQRSHGVEHLPTHVGEAVIDAHRLSRRGRAQHIAVALQAARRAGQHLLRDAGSGAAGC